MACGITFEETNCWLPLALQNRLNNNSQTVQISESTVGNNIASDINNWLKLIRCTVDEYEEKPRKNHQQQKTIIINNDKVLSDSDLSANSFDYIDKELLTKDNSDATNEDEEAYAISVFDDILCNLGNEIFQLESYHRKYFQTQRGSDSSELEQNIMHVFDEFLEDIRSSTPVLDSSSMKSCDVSDNDSKGNNMDLKVPVISKVPSFGNISALSDEVFLKSATSSRDGSNSNLYVQCDSSAEDKIIIRNLSHKINQTKHSSFDVNRIFDKGTREAPVPPKRRNRLSTPTPLIGAMERTEVHLKKPVPKPRTFINNKMNDQRIKLDSNNIDITQRLSQKSTSRYKSSHRNDSDSGNNSPTSDYSDYQNIWHCTSGCQNRVIDKSDSFKENYGTVNVIRYDSFKEIPTSNVIKPVKHRIVVCGPHTNKPNNKTSDTLTRSDKGAENEGVVNHTNTTARFDNFDKNKRYSYDGRKREEHNTKSSLTNNDNVVRCTSDCDITDECHRSLPQFRQNRIMQNRHNDISDDVKSVSSLQMPKRAVSEIPKTASYQNISDIIFTKCTNYEQNDNISDIIDSSSVYDTDGGNYTTAATTTEEEWESSAELLSDSDSFIVSKNINDRIIRRNVGKRTVSESTDCASESPIYENVRDLIKVKAVPDDVIAWKALLFTVDWIEDEEDEWATKEQAEIYTRDCQLNGPTAPYTGYVIPRVKPVYSSKKHRREEHQHPHHQHSGEEIIDHDDWSSERGSEQGSVKDKAKIYEKKGMIMGPGEQGRLKDRSMMGSSPPIPSYRIPDPRLHQLEFRSSANFDGSRPQRVKSLGPMKAERTVLTTKDILHCGNVRVVKKAENGVKIPKQWHDNFLILKSDRLVFYDSEKAWRDQHLHRFDIILKDGLVDLENVKKRIKIVDANNDMYVTEHPNEREAKEWMGMIRSNTLVVASASQPSPIASPSPTLARHRTKSTSKAASDESVNDIPSTGGSQENIPKNNKTTSKILDKWLRKRPQKDTLINKGIYQDEAIFGRNLWEVCPLEKPRIPDFVVRCVRVIEGNIQNMTTDGIYRASGNLSQIQKIRLDVNQKNLSVVNDTVDVHVLTGALKLFFRELKEPLIPFEFFQKALNASCKPDHDSRIKEFREIVRKLPDCNKDTLTFFLEHLLNVTKHEDKNRMKVSNLAIVLGPTILWAPPNATQNLALDFLKQNEVIECLLNDYKLIFQDEKLDGLKKFETKM